MTQRSRRTCCNSKLGGDASRSSTRCGGKAVQGLRLDSRRWGPSTPQHDSQANHVASLRMTGGRGSLFGTAEAVPLGNGLHEEWFQLRAAELRLRKKTKRASTKKPDPNVSSAEDGACPRDRNHHAPEIWLKPTSAKAIAATQVGWPSRQEITLIMAMSRRADRSSHSLCLTKASVEITPAAAPNMTIAVLIVGCSSALQANCRSLDFASSFANEGCAQDDTMEAFPFALSERFLRALRGEHARA
jgi:hypothetical protein